jgi:hypothetical protein
MFKGETLPNASHYRMRVSLDNQFGALGEAVMGLDMNELAFHL